MVGTGRHPEHEGTAVVVEAAAELEATVVVEAAAVVEATART